eukprot:8723651-Pyramimonas_sp.AAC.1
MQRPGTVVSDHLSFVKEALRWDDKLEHSSSRHAGLWRQLHTFCHDACESCNFVWVPSHQDVLKFVEEGGSYAHCVGNAWADFFAYAGATG